MTSTDGGFVAVGDARIRGAGNGDAGPWQPHAERGSGPGLAVDDDGPARLGDGAVGAGEAEARSSTLRFGGEVGIEHAADVTGGDSCAGVADIEPDVASNSGLGRGQRLPARRRWLGVDGCGDRRVPPPGIASRALITKLVRSWSNRVGSITTSVSVSARCSWMAMPAPRRSPSKVTIRVVSAFTSRAVGASSCWLLNDSRSAMSVRVRSIVSLAASMSTWSSSP